MGKAIKTKLQINARTEVGKVREHNEDNFIVNNNLLQNNWYLNHEVFQLDNWGCLMMVADGMGGANAGEVASEKAVEGIKGYFNQLDKNSILNPEIIKEHLKKATLYAHQKIVDYAKIFPDTEGMGTTIVLVWIWEVQAFVIWSGDSRVYLFRPGTGLKQLSEDHSYVWSLVKQEKLTPEQAFYHPENNVILQSLGNEEHPPKPDFASCSLITGDKILLCSDGLNGMLQDEEIEKIIRNESNLEACSQKLIEAALKAGGHDNITLVMCDVIQSPLSLSNISKPQNNPKNKRVIITIPISKNLLSLIIAFLLLCGGFFAGKYFLSENNNDKKDSATQAQPSPKKDSTKVSKPEKSKKDSKKEFKNKEEKPKKVKSDDKTENNKKKSENIESQKIKKEENINSKYDKINKQLKKINKTITNTQAKQGSLKPLSNKINDFQKRMDNTKTKNTDEKKDVVENILQNVEYNGDNVALKSDIEHLKNMCNDFIKLLEKF